MKFHLSDQHIVVCIFQNRDDHTAFTSDRFQFIWRCTEDNLKVLVLEEIMLRTIEEVTSRLRGESSPPLNGISRMLKRSASVWSSLRCVDEITEQVRRNTGLSVTDIQIERVLNGQSCSMDPAAKEIIVRQGRLYTEKILSAIMEAGFDLKAQAKRQGGAERYVHDGAGTR